MTEKPDHDFQQLLTDAFTSGLREKFGELVGRMLGEVIPYYPHLRLEPERLERLVADDGAAALQAIVANRVDDASLRLIRAQMIGSALLADRAAINRWATEGLQRAGRAGGAWAETDPQWRWVLENPDRYILYVRRLKQFMNQV